MVLLAFNLPFRLTPILIRVAVVWIAAAIDFISAELNGPEPALCFHDVPHWDACKQRHIGSQEKLLPIPASLYFSESTPTKIAFLKNWGVCGIFSCFCQA